MEARPPLLPTETKCVWQHVCVLTHAWHVQWLAWDNCHAKAITPALHPLPTICFDWLVAMACVIVGISQCWRWNRLPPHDLHSSRVNLPFPPGGKWRWRAANTSEYLKPRIVELNNLWFQVLWVKHVFDGIKRVQDHPGTHLMQAAERAFHYQKVEGGRLLPRWRRRQDPPQTWLDHVHEAALRREWE